MESLNMRKPKKGELIMANRRITLY